MPPWITVGISFMTPRRRDLGNIIESYTEVARRLGVMKEMPTVIQGGIH